MKPTNTQYSPALARDSEALERGATPREEGHR